MSQQELKQASVRAATRTVLDYNGDWHALFDQAGIPAGDFDGRMLRWINARLGGAFADLPGALQAFAVSQGAPNWSSLGAFSLGLAPPDVNTVPLLAAGYGDSITGSGGTQGQLPAFNRGAGNIQGNLRYANRGRPGQYSQVSYANLAGDITALGASLLIINDNTNDRGGGVQTIQAGTGNVGNGVYYNRQAITDHLAANANNKVVYCTHNPKADGSTITNDRFVWTTMLADFTSGLFAGVFNSRVFYCDMASSVSNTTTGLPLSAGNFQPDLVHPTAQGSRLMGNFLHGFMVAKGLIYDGFYPWTRNQATTDPRNLLGAGGTFQGTPQGNGVANGWTLSGGDAALAYSVVAAASGLGNAQRVVMGAGQSVFTQILRNVNISARVGHRIAVMARTSGSGFEASGALVQVKWTVSGSNQNISPMNAASFINPAPIDGDQFHYGEFVAGAGAGNLTTSFVMQSNAGATAATLDIYDVLLMDLG